MTIYFHVDNQKLSHMDQSILDDVVKQLNDAFRTSKEELTETKGPIHEYLDLTMDYSKKNQVMVTMDEYIKDIIGTTPLDMNGMAPDLAKAGLFTFDKSLPLLNVDGADFFHRMTTRLLFAAKRTRPNIQVTVAYLYTRVR